MKNLFFLKKRFLKEKNVFENKNIANDPKNEPLKKIFLGKNCSWKKIVFENFVLKIFFSTMARQKIPVPNQRRLNVHAKSHGPISLRLLLQNQVEYAVRKPGGVCCYKSKT